MEAFTDVGLGPSMVTGDFGLVVVCSVGRVSVSPSMEAERYWQRN